MTPQHEVVIIGAGFGGMGAAIQLKELGIEDLLILDRENDLGGTWHVNRYPGLAVDIASVTYSYSFEPNPYWSRVFAPGAELKKYAEHVADKYDLRRHMRFDTVVHGARWDQDAQHWIIGVGGGEVITARYLLSATGFLSQPNLPDIAGIGSFAGTILHSADWEETTDLTGRKVAIIGTGATGVQLIPQLARKAETLTVFQRTPIWVVPKVDFAIPAAVQTLFARVPAAQRAARSAYTTLLEAIMVTAVLHYRQAGFLNKIATAAARTHLFAQVRDRSLRAKLVPEYSFGCKRPTFSNTYYPTFNQDHVHLETTPIARIEPGAIVTSDGVRTEIDTLVLATGFNIWDTNFPALEMIGREGRDLGKWWRENRFQAYQGLSVPYFPNYLTLASPYAYSGMSYFDTIESQMKHLRRLFGELRRNGAKTFEVTEQANTEFLDQVTGRLGDSVFYRGNCASSRSYYFNQHGEAALLRPTPTRTAYREQNTFPIDAYTYGRLN
ncbi:flavin-containing monooxygenase [Nocardia sp. NPDC056000]|uniref:flavin-containing monooxygenase n=1 Tax=Nocardia sp. NPDC056000 TaxID=3345674 RepID=UPI0035D9724F